MHSRCAVVHKITDMIVWFSYMLQFISICLAGGSNNEMYIIINIEKAGREFQTGNKKQYQ